MDLFALLFYVFAVVIIGGAAVMVFSRNIVHAAFALMFTLAGLAVFYGMLSAGFVAVTQLLVYVGGILVLILFGVMLTTRGYFEKVAVRKVNMVPAVLFSALVGVLLLYVVIRTAWVLEPLGQEDALIAVLGERLLTDFMLPFQVAGVLLLLAIIGAVLMATRRNPAGASARGDDPDRQ